MGTRPGIDLLVSFSSHSHALPAFTSSMVNKADHATTRVAYKPDSQSTEEYIAIVNKPEVRMIRVGVQSVILILSAYADSTRSGRRVVRVPQFRVAWTIADDTRSYRHVTTSCFQ
jgi:hypothetical protein